MLLFLKKLTLVRKCLAPQKLFLPWKKNSWDGPKMRFCCQRIEGKFIYCKKMLVFADKKLILLLKCQNSLQERKKCNNKLISIFHNFLKQQKSKPTPSIRVGKKSGTRTRSFKNIFSVELRYPEI